MSKKNIAASKQSGTSPVQDNVVNHPPLVTLAKVPDTVSDSAESPRTVPPLSVEAAKLILEDIVTVCEYDEWVTDGLLRLLCGIKAQGDYTSVVDYIDWLLMFLYAQSHDFSKRMTDHLGSLPAKSHRDDKLTLDQLAEAMTDRKRTELLLEARERANAA